MTAPVEIVPDEFFADRLRVDGSRSFWATSARGTVLTRWDAVDDGWSEPTSVAATSWRDAVAADADLVSIRADELTDFTAPETDALLDLLVLDGRGDADELDALVDQAGWDGVNEDFTFDEGQVNRHVRVNGQWVEFVLTDDDSAVAVAVEDDEPAGATQLGILVWNFGGDPAAGYLYSVRPGVAVGFERSESNQMVQGFRHGTDAHGQARLLQAWLHYANGFGTGGGAAALALEPVDPNGVLSADVRAGWDDALAQHRVESDYTFRVTFDVAPAVEEQLRTILAADDPDYVRVRDALAHPIEGHWLRDELLAFEFDSLK